MQFLRIMAQVHSHNRRILIQCEQLTAVHLCSLLTIRLSHRRFCDVCKGCVKCDKNKHQFVYCADHTIQHKKNLPALQFRFQSGCSEYDGSAYLNTFINSYKYKPAFIISFIHSFIIQRDMQRIFPRMTVPGNLAQLSPPFPSLYRPKTRMVHNLTSPLSLRKRITPPHTPPQGKLSKRCGGTGVQQLVQRLGYRQHGSQFESRSEIFSPQNTSRLTLGPSQPPLQGVAYLGSLSEVKRPENDGTTHLPLAPRLRLSGAIPLLPSVLS